MTTAAPAKLTLVVNYGGRLLPIEATSHEQVLALRNKAMNEFGIHADRDSLALFRLDNTMLDDHAQVAAYGLAEQEQLVLRQRQTGGG